MLRTIALVPALIIALAGSALAQCRPNYVGAFLTTPSGTPITAAVHRDSLCLGGPCLWKAQWNNALGSAHCDAVGPSCSGEGVSASDVGQFTSDDFVLTGPSGPNPVAIQVLLHLTGLATSVCHTVCDPQVGGCVTTCTPGYIVASLGDGTQQATTGQVATLNTALQLNLSKAVGAPFHLDCSLYVHSYCNSSSGITSQLEIVLPPGYGITSCYGFSASGPTPALPATWGRMKSTYRS